MHLKILEVLSAIINNAVKKIYWKCRIMRCFTGQ